MHVSSVPCWLNVGTYNVMSYPYSKPKCRELAIYTIKYIGPKYQLLLWAHAYIINLVKKMLLQLIYCKTPPYMLYLVDRWSLLHLQNINSTHRSQDLCESIHFISLAVHIMQEDRSSSMSKDVATDIDCWYVCKLWIEVRHQLQTTSIKDHNNLL